MSFLRKSKQRTEHTVTHEKLESKISVRNIKQEWEKKKMNQEHKVSRKQRETF